MRLLSQTVPNFDKMYIYEMVNIKNSLVSAFDSMLTPNFTENKLKNYCKSYLMIFWLVGFSLYKFK